MKRKTAPVPPIKPGLPGRRKFWLVSACAVSLLVAFVAVTLGTGCGISSMKWGETTRTGSSTYKTSSLPFRETVVRWESRGEQDMRAMTQVVQSGLGMPFHQDSELNPGAPVYLAPSGITSIRIGRNRVVVRAPAAPPETKGSAEQLAAAITAAARASGLPVR